MKKIFIYSILIVILIVSYIGIRVELTKMYEITDLKHKFNNAMKSNDYYNAYIEAGNVSNAYLKHGDWDNYHTWKTVQDNVLKSHKCPYN